MFTCIVSSPNPSGFPAFNIEIWGVGRVHIPLNLINLFPSLSSQLPPSSLNVKRSTVNGRMQWSAAFAGKLQR